MKFRSVLIPLCALVPFGLSAAEITQVIPLLGGWNAICLEVTPEDNSVESVFSSLTEAGILRGVWRHHTEQSTVRFIEDPADLLEESKDWLTWFPQAVNASVIKTLHTVHGGTCYLIELDSTAGPVDLSITGRPILDQIQWIKGEYTLTGLCVDPVSPPTFAEYFADSPAHDVSLIRKMDPTTGNWVAVGPTESIVPGNGYWIYTNDYSDYQGPVAVRADNRGLLDFSNYLVERPFILENEMGSAVNFLIRPVAADGSGVIAGELALSIYDDWSPTQDLDGDGIPDLPGWVELGPGGITVPVDAGQAKDLRLAIRRQDMTGLGVDLPFESVLEITTVAGTCHLLGVRADGFADISDPAYFAGLWIGSAVVDRIQQVTGEEPHTLQGTSSEATLRMLVHVDGTGQATFLREVLIVWLQGVLDPDTGEVTEPGKYLAFRDGAAIEAWKTANPTLAERLGNESSEDGSFSRRRSSSAGFSFVGGQPFTGNFGTGVLNVTLQRPAASTDGLNPYRHRYHPDHAGGFDLTRTISLTFDAASSIPDNAVSGTYNESIEGLYKEPILVAGSFRLVRSLGPVEYFDQ